MRYYRLTQTQIDEKERALAHAKVCTEDEPCVEHGGTFCYWCGERTTDKAQFCSKPCENAYEGEADPAAHAAAANDAHADSDRDDRMLGHGVYTP